MSKRPAFLPPLGEHPLGKIEVLPRAIHSIAVRAISECYGVVGIASPYLRKGRAVLLSAERAQEGVQVRLIDEQIILDVFVVIEYGLSVIEIAHNVMSTVRFSVSKMLSMPVAQVNVHVQGLGDVTEQQTP
jgi:uncharacterized alkaline shock family protein YloU